MQEIKLNDKVIGYVEEAKDVLKYLPTCAPDGFKMLGGKTDRELLYGDDLYVITKSSKKRGTNINDICPVCGIGVVAEIAGCHSCPVCSAQLRCGL